jgi:hypothetical protein
VTSRSRRIAALAAVFAPARAGALLARLSDADAADAIDGAAALSASSRRDRLRALAGALAVDPGERRARAEAAAACERAAVAALLRAVAAGAPPAGASPALVRLCRETIGR